MANDTVSVKFGADVSDLSAGLAVAQEHVKQTTRAFQDFTKSIVQENASGVVSESDLANLRVMKGAADAAKASVAAMGQTAAQAGQLAGWQMRQLSFQLNDVATMAAMGAPPLQILASQGGQIYQLLAETPGGAAAGVKALGTQLLGLATPVNLAIAGIAGIAAGAAYAAYKMFEFDNSVKAIQLTSTINQMQLTSDAAGKLIDAIKKASDTSTSEAQKIAQAFLSIGPGAGEIAKAASVYLPMLAKAMGTDAATEAEKLASMFRDLSGAGRQYVSSTNGVTAGILEAYDGFVRTGQAGEAYAIILQSLANRLDGAWQAQARQNTQTLTLAESVAVGISGIAAMSVREQMLAENAAVATKKIDEQTAAIQSNIAAVKAAANAQAVFNQGLATAARFDTLRNQIASTTAQITNMKAALSIAQGNNDASGMETLQRGIERAQDSLKRLQQQASDGLLGRDLLSRTSGDLTAQDASFKGAESNRLKNHLATMQQMLASDQLTAAQRDQLEGQVAATTKQIRDAEFAEQQARDQIAITRAGDDKNAIIRIRQQELDETIKIYGEGSVQALSAMNALESARQDAAKKSGAGISPERFKLNTENNEKQTKLFDIDTQMMEIKSLASAREIDFETERQQLLALAQQRKQIELQYTTDKASQSSQRAKIEASSLKEVTKINLEVNRQILADYKQTYESIGQNVSSSIMQMIQGQQTLIGSAKSVLLQLLEMFVQARMKIVADWAAGIAAQTVATQAGETAKTASVTSGAAARTAAEQSADTASMASNFSSILKAVQASASQTFAGIFGFLAPIMGPAAVGPAAAGEATVMGAASAIPSFAVGAWSLPSDMVAQVHQGEMIVPAGPAAAFRSMMSAGNAPSSGVTVHHTSNFNFSTIDGQSTAAFFRNHGKTLMRTINENVRSGAQLGMSKIGNM